ncbi:hypothetical protein [Flavobacterium agrisoli]|uniref:Periplasmic chaperone for outer membrane proteins Skp n=1 Tax=Flavobacterium agrisoli TaxID=2793066 RepID=A0A934UJM0_9FLAO|nr:hypothetical protein [Flavobacterium agrisoli]MBK0370037.1 hypothetical protein [Flavobacterium agrisoli]
MKKMILSAIFGFMAMGMMAQETSANDDMAILQSVYGKSKTDLVNEYLKLSDTQKTAFQKVYDDYETKRKEIGLTKMNLINDYADNYANLTDEKANELAKAALKANSDLDKLYSKTYSKAKSAIGATNAAKFIQLEEYLQTIIKSTLQENIPLIGELDEKKI